MTRVGRLGLVLSALTLAILSGCAGQGPGTTGAANSQPGQSAAPARAKALTIGVTGSIAALSIAGGSSPVGGWVAMTEMFTDGLITADTLVHKPIGRMAQKVPSLDDGTISVLPDGRMRVQFTLRKGITWQDGVPFTADDFVFSYLIGGPDGLPTSTNDATRVMTSVEAPDPQTVVIYYKQSYYLGANLGPIMFWPLPRHLLAETYARYV